VIINIYNNLQLSRYNISHILILKLNYIQIYLKKANL